MSRVARTRGLILVCLLLSLLAFSPSRAAVPASTPAFSFVVVSDVRNWAGPGAYDTPAYFRGAAEAIAARGGGDLMLSPGDIDPVDGVYWTITSTLGSDYAWFPVVGNHELPGGGSEPSPGANMAWLRAYDYDANGPGLLPDLVRTGPAGCPETTFSFDYGNAHFVVLNQYCDESGDTATDGDMPDHLYDWLVADVAATDQEHIFVFGHEPAFPQPDADSGRLRHENDSLNKYPAHRDRFWAFLSVPRVRAYFCGHTHNYSAVQIDGVWQIDAGHARGEGDTGAPSTFLIVRVDGALVRFEAYRDLHDGQYDYDDLVHSGILSSYYVYLPLVQRQ